MATDDPKKKKPADDKGKKPASDAKPKKAGGPPPPEGDVADVADPAGAGPAPDPNALPFPPITGMPPAGPDPMAGMMGGGPPDLAAMLGLGGGGMPGGGPMGGPMGAPMGGPMGGPPPGPQLPIGGSMPAPGDFGDSPLIAALASQMADPYAVNGMPTDLNVGPQNPQAGLQGLLQMLAFAQLGVPGVGAGGSGVPMDMGMAGSGLLG
jgi:hypothetical protein